MLTRALVAGAELRLFDEADAEELFALVAANRAHLRRWLPWVDGNDSVAGTLEFIRASRKQLEEKRGTQLAVVCAGKIVGVVGYHTVDWENRSTSIGYWLAEEYQGRGLMTEAVRALVDHAFSVWKLNLVEIRAAAENARSRAIPERLGFTQEGVLRQREWLYDRFVDHVSYSLLASEWRRGGAPPR